MRRGLRERLVGAWKLVSYVEKPIDGSAPFYPMGEEPQGIIMYTPDGYMPAQLIASESSPVIATQKNGETIRFPVEGVEGGSISILTVRVG